MGYGGKTSPIHKAPPLFLQDLKDLLLMTWRRIPQQTFSGLAESTALQTRAALVANVDVLNNGQAFMILWLIGVLIHNPVLFKIIYFIPLIIL